MSRVPNDEIQNAILVNQMTILATLSQLMPEGDTTALPALNMRVKATHSLVERMLGREPVIITDPRIGRA